MFITSINSYIFLQRKSGIHRNSNPSWTTRSWLSARLLTSCLSKLLSAYLRNLSTCFCSTASTQFFDHLRSQWNQESHHTIVLQCRQPWSSHSWRTASISVAHGPNSYTSAARITCVCLQFFVACAASWKMPPIVFKLCLPLPVSKAFASFTVRGASEIQQLNSTIFLDKRNG